VADGPARGADLVGLGEIGIGNTTAAAALVCAFAGASPEEVVGPGTGVDGAARARKVAVVADALRRHGPPRPGDPLATAAALGGAELLAMAGFALACAAARVPVVLDGLLSGAAALVAAALDPGVVPYLLASHASAEPGARVALARLGLEPLFDLGLRLGEGTGAVLGMALVRDAVALQAEMATFATAGVREGA
jgi:nicotinate-nucleotide--dimethylbenzimidazole phosphoribosyltransferase